MPGVITILRHEWANFLRSDRSAFLVHGILVFAWSFVLYTNAGDTGLETGMLWWVFFSVIVSGSFSNSVFAGERQNGSLEVLLCCGLSRNAILAGKIVFVTIMSVILGLLCCSLAFLWTITAGKEPVINNLPVLAAAWLYLSACFMNSACSAWLSAFLSNPRMSHFVNLLVLGVIVAVYTAFSGMAGITEWLLAALILIAGLLFLALAQKAFNGEKVIQPYSC